MKNLFLIFSYQYDSFNCLFRSRSSVIAAAGRLASSPLIFLRCCVWYLSWNGEETSGAGRRGFMGDKGQSKSNKSKHTLELRLVMLTAGPSGPWHTQESLCGCLCLLTSTGKQTTQHEGDKHREKKKKHYTGEQEGKVRETSKHRVIVRSLTREEEEEEDLNKWKKWWRQGLTRWYWYYWY